MTRRQLLAGCVVCIQPIAGIDTPGQTAFDRVNAEETIAFRVPTADEWSTIRFFAYSLHTDNPSTMFTWDGRRLGPRCAADCGGCTDRRREHDPGDEDG